MKEDTRKFIVHNTKEILCSEFTGIKTRVEGELGSKMNFSCPVCGDSKSKQSVKRGYIFFDSATYHCFNGGCSAKQWSLTKFFKHFNIRLDIDTIKELNSIKLEHVEKKTSITINSSSEVFKFIYSNSIPVDRIVSNYKLVKASKPWHVDFIKSRRLGKKGDLLWFNTSTKNRQVFILNTIEDKVVGLQIRNLDIETKYFTKTLSVLHKEVNGDSIHNGDDNFMDHVNTLSLIFNIFNVSLDTWVTVFEGPIDSLFYNNSIATAGASKLNDFFDDLDIFRYFYDNDKTGIKYSKEKIKKNKTVFLWRKWLSDNKIEDDIKDLNDALIYILDNKLKVTNFSNYFSNKKLDLYYI